MNPVTLDFLNEQLRLADELLTRRAEMFEPQDLPGRYGRVVRAVDHLLQATGTPAVLGGGWAVWRHGYLGRITQDLDMILPSDRVDDFLQAASVAGFEVLPKPEGRWPRLLHKETGVQVDILPEGARPGTASRPAPTTIPHPAVLGARGQSLCYINLHSLVELKLAAGRARDESDVVELIRANPDQVDAIRQHLAAVHADYVGRFDGLVQRARDESDN
ncbi:MAG TPA: hypothetical protein VNK04_03480 [Gemmataceae bacterium]|nr:hypothetical protein [Gemmataceae bacterium]